jgi:probable rRNA maturation factor
MTVAIRVQQTSTRTDYGDLVRRAAQATLNMSNVDDGELTVVLTGDDEVRRLNKQHRRIDGTTDVLSFPLGELDPESGSTYLGDVVISMDRAANQAKGEGHSLGAELALLTVHGVLHLLGHDHHDQDSRSAMWTVQRSVLQGLGNEVTEPPAG